MHEAPANIILDCGHCGNRTPHKLQHSYRHSLLIDMTQDDEPITEPFDWISYSCGTCGGLNVYGGLQLAYYQNWRESRLHPRSVALSPPAHTVSPSIPVPDAIRKVYEEIWPLRHRSPTAFVGQIRRLLEFVCQDHKAVGRDLFHQLDDLRTRGIIPGHFEGIATLIRRVGNLGAHASVTTLTTWDAELVDDFFRFLLDYVYVAPARIRRLEQRLQEHGA